MKAAQQWVTLFKERTGRPVTCWASYRVCRLFLWSVEYIFSPCQIRIFPGLKGHSAEVTQKYQFTHHQETLESNGEFLGSVRFDLSLAQSNRITVTKQSMLHQQPFHYPSVAILYIYNWKLATLQQSHQQSFCAPETGGSCTEICQGREKMELHTQCSDSQRLQGEIGLKLV